MTGGVTQDGQETIVINVCVSRVITVVQAFAAKTVSSPEIVTGLQAIVTEDVNKDGWEANVINSVSPDTMGKIVRTCAAVTVYMIITDVTGLQDNATLGVNPDGQETDVISNVSWAFMGYIVITNVAYTVTIANNVTLQRDIVTTGVHSDGQEENVINSVSLATMVRIAWADAA